LFLCALRVCVHLGLPPSPTLLPYTTLFRSRWRSRSSSVKFGSTWDLRQISSISSSAGISASGMNLPPNAPKYGPVSWLTSLIAVFLDLLLSVDVLGTTSIQAYGRMCAVSAHRRSTRLMGVVGVQHADRRRSRPMAVYSSTADCRRPPVTRASQTSTRSAPATAYYDASRAPVTPDSATKVV